MKKRIAILGSTGSIGTQSLEVIEQNPDKFEVEVLTANNNVDLLIQQAKKFRPNVVVVANAGKYKLVSEALANEPVKVFAGTDSLNQVVEMESVDLVLTAMVGYSGLIPPYHAIKAKKNVALANKETLVVAGEIITRLATENQVDILPIDSEHSAIFQCLVGEFMNPLEKIILTCSGGPFRGKSRDELKNVTVAGALNHPNWEMGAKITIDSATLMNKGFEMIEAILLLLDRRPQHRINSRLESPTLYSLILVRPVSIRKFIKLFSVNFPISRVFISSGTTIVVSLSSNSMP
ncbi:MAG: 1-deoxy-D-xylulose-5-phosphate reductoisomerase [Bacteroidia bacterium]|nr:1-deoxy-D-xylulose-5-phosphate reductoisomerase [Bacteroidia bacterium]